MSDKVYGILLAGGSGQRMGAPMNKILLKVGGIPCIARSADALAPFVDELILVGRKEDESELRLAMRSASGIRGYHFVKGGATRQDSVQAGLCFIPEAESDSCVVIIHDGARCLLSAEVTERVLASVQENGSGVAAIPVTNTLRQADASGLAGKTVPRDGLFQMQTPQGFRLGELRAAFRKAYDECFQGTDDAEVMAYAGFPVYLSKGAASNIKLTTKEDLSLAESMLSHSSIALLRVGHGYDVHRLAEDRKLILCGVEVPHTWGLLGHSDADVAVHALMDALLGAAGLGDIGRHFPDTDPKYKGISSMLLLAEVMRLLNNAGFRPVNADITIIAQKPKLAPFIPRMEENLASALGLPLSCVNVKATTTESLGFEGRQEGISSHAVCLIQSATPSASEG